MDRRGVGFETKERELWRGPEVTVVVETAADADAQTVETGVTVASPELPQQEPSRAAPDTGKTLDFLSCPMPLELSDVIDAIEDKPLVVGP